MLAVDGEDALDQIRIEQPDLTILDLMMPKLDGLGVCRTLRSSGYDGPILMLTARDGVSDRVAGLDAGADDYLPKPFALEELLARLRALLRRVVPEAEAGSAVMSFADLTMDPVTRDVHRGERSIALTRTEYSLLELLLANPHRVLPKPLILDKLYSFDQDIESNTVEVHVHHLRRKIAPKLVRTVRGVGYALGAPEELE